MKKYLILMRVHHWLKNCLIFLPVFFVGEFFNFCILKNTMLGFCSFSLMSSAIYIINDLKDVENDKNHDKKRNRPLASGDISIERATVLLVLLFIVGMLINFFIAGSLFISWVYILVYFMFNCLYSFGFKNIPLIDIIILVSGYLIRVLYGGIISGFEVSNWMYLTIMSGSFYLGLGKRRNEIQRNGTSARSVLKHYSKSFLDKNMYLCLTLTIVFYSMWCLDITTVIASYGTSIVWTIPVVLIIFMKYSMNIEGNSFGDPVDVLFDDKLLMLLIAAYAFVMLLIVYGDYFINFIR